MKRATRRRRQARAPLTPERRRDIIAQGIVYLREEYPNAMKHALAIICAGRLAIEPAEVLAVIERVQA